ncbi:MAG: PTS glucose transporter subunit IIA [Lachnospiraceae bacterium]|nr:PTS glucose transporter subunit IIA [Lachnospiraceae bacterium]
MKDKIFGVLQRVGRSFMLPIAILPVAGLLLGIGSSFTNETVLRTYRLVNVMGKGTVLNAVLQVMSKAGDIVFANLPLLFAVGVAIGMARKEKEVAALAATIAFLIMHASVSAMIHIFGGEEGMLSGAVTSVCGISSLQMGVFGGIIVGLGVAALHNRFYKIELPQVLSFFGGTRFVPIICSLVYVFVGILMFFIWPLVQNGIYAVGEIVLKSGYFGTWVYGLMERLLIPFGLHHVFYLPFWQTAVGGTLEVGGELVEGAQNIFFAQLAAPETTQFAVSATRFMSGKFPLMIFGLPGAAFAMYKCAKKEKRQVVGGLLLSAALTSMLTGITEPIEFTFLFVAPLLYGIHCVLAGLAYMLMHLFEVGVGMTFSGGLIDLFLFGVLQGNEKTNWIWVLIIGVFYFALYYFLFSFLIRKLDLKTPGRGEEEVKLYKRSDMENRKKQDENKEERLSEQDLLSERIIKGLGGRNNISDVDCCATRLRCTVFEASLVDEDMLKSTGASGVVHKGMGVQIIYGPKVTVIKSNLEDYLERCHDIVHDEVGVHIEEVEKKAYDEERKIIETIVIKSPIKGVADSLTKAPDEAFASGMMGDGVLVEPLGELVCAPDDGEVTFVFDTKHAVGFLTDSGIQLLIHIGIDTVSLKGEGFDILVESGEKVKKGTPLLRLDLEYLKEHAPFLSSPILCTELGENQGLRMLTQGMVEQGAPLFAVDIYETKD